MWGDVQILLYAVLLTLRRYDAQYINDDEQLSALYLSDV